MARSLVLGNEENLLTLDKFGRVSDWYYPYIGFENHLEGKNSVHKIGVFVDGKISWFGEDLSWQINFENEKESTLSVVKAVNEYLKLEISFKNFFHHEKNIFIRDIKITNKARKGREIKLYFTHSFDSGKNYLKSATFFDNKNHCLIHHKGERVFLINGEIDGEPFTEYSLGECSEKDANDGLLTKNSAEIDSGTSAIGFSEHILGGKMKTLHYWVISGKSIEEAQSLNTSIFKENLEKIAKNTDKYWLNYINKCDFSFYKLSRESEELFRKSLQIVKMHTDRSGGTISSSDSSAQEADKDFYSYIRVGESAFSALSLLHGGDKVSAKRFFKFCGVAISKDGYFFPKYLPNGSVGPSNFKSEDGTIIPIKESDTAIALWALYEFYKETHDIDFVESLYEDFVEKSSDFLHSYRDTRLKLPRPSFDLWGENISISTFTSSAVYGALAAASEVSRLLGKMENSKKYRGAAEEIKKGIINYLYDKKSGNFFKSINFKNGHSAEDNTVDISSAFGVYTFGVLPVSDLHLQRAMNQILGALSNKLDSFGLARFFDDDNYRISRNIPGNIWFISTLWFVQYLIAKAQSEKDFDKIRQYLNWVPLRLSKQDIMPEQLNPLNGEPLSAAPFILSHAEYVNTVVKYMNRLDELGVSKKHKIPW